MCSVYIYYPHKLWEHPLFQGRLFKCISWLQVLLRTIQVMKIVISGTHCIHWNTILTHPPRYSMLLEASKRSKMHKIILHENLHAGSDSIAVKAIFSGYCRDQCCLQDGVFPLKKEHTSSSTTLRLYDDRLRILHIQQSVTGKEWLTNDILVQSVGHCDASNHRVTF